MEFICFSDLHISPTTREKSAYVLAHITEDILSRLPDAIVCVGDIGTFDSHNKKSDLFQTSEVEEERKSVADVLCTHLFKPLSDYNDRRREMKKKLYKPTILFCLGNHDKLEHRWFKGFFEAVSKRIGIDIIVADNKELVWVYDVCFSHTFDKGISGVAHTTCAGLLKDLHCSCVQGHRHVREVAEDRTLEGNKIFCICLPAATTDRPIWAYSGATKWDTGWLRLTTGGGEPHYEFMEVDDGGV